MFFLYSWTHLLILRVSELWCSQDSQGVKFAMNVGMLLPSTALGSYGASTPKDQAFHEIGAIYHILSDTPHGMWTRIKPALEPFSP